MSPQDEAAALSANKKKTVAKPRMTKKIPPKKEIFKTRNSKRSNQSEEVAMSSPTKKNIFPKCKDNAKSKHSPNASGSKDQSNNKPESKKKDPQNFIKNCCLKEKIWKIYFA